MNSKTNKLDNTAYWDQRQDKISTDIGMWQAGKQVTVHGKKLFKEPAQNTAQSDDCLFDNIGYFQMLVLNATGKMISKNLSTWLENNYMVMSYPDARIWCNTVGALCGTLKTSPTAATAAGVLAADSRIYGGSQTSRSAMQFIIQALEDYNRGTSIEDIVNKTPIRQGKPAVMGFARPVASDDERIGPHKEMTIRLGFGIGPHMHLANQISSYLEENYGMGINIGGYTVAFMADQGFTPQELYQIKCICVASGITACYVDNLRHPENSFLPLKCKDIGYEGPPKRTL